MKYADPEVQHASEALMRLALLFIIEGSYGRKEFVIDDEKLLKRIGLIDEKGKNKARAKDTLNAYVTKLINHGILESEEKQGSKRVFKITPRAKNEDKK